MNPLQLLTAFSQKIQADQAISPAHISLYLAIHQHWVANAFQNPFNVTRSTLMRSSKIQSFVTYHKCIRDLHKLEYIIYTPSYHPKLGSQIYLPNLIST